MHIPSKGGSPMKRSELCPLANRNPIPIFRNLRQRREGASHPRRRQRRCHSAHALRHRGRRHVTGEIHRPPRVRALRKGVKKFTSRPPGKPSGLPRRPRPATFGHLQGVERLRDKPGDIIGIPLGSDDVRTNGFAPPTYSPDAYSGSAMVPLILSTNS